MEGGNLDLLSDVEKHSLLILSLAVVHPETVNERNRTGKCLCARAICYWKHKIIQTCGPELTEDLWNRRE